MCERSIKCITVRARGPICFRSHLPSIKHPPECLPGNGMASICPAWRWRLPVGRRGARAANEKRTLRACQSSPGPPCPIMVSLAASTPPAASNTVYSTYTDVHMRRVLYTLGNAQLLKGSNKKRKAKKENAKAARPRVRRYSGIYQGPRVGE
jgi:hypothetical protein